MMSWPRRAKARFHSYREYKVIKYSKIPKEKSLFKIMSACVVLLWIFQGCFFTSGIYESWYPHNSKWFSVIPYINAVTTFPGTLETQCFWLSRIRWQTYGMHAQNGTWKYFLGMWHSLLSQFLFLLPNKCLYIMKNMCIYIYIYIYIHISDTVQTVYELLLLPNITAVKHFYTNWKQSKVLTGYLSVGHQHGGDWVNTWHWTKCFAVFFWNKKQYQPTVTAKFSSLSHSLKRPLLEIKLYHALIM
jgi:hypothetical protein